MKLSAILTLSLVSLALAAGEKLEGKAKCAKCHLKASESCQSVLVMKGKDGKETTYYVEKGDKAEAFHEEVCQDEKSAVVEGTISEKDGKKLIKVTKFEVK